MTPARLVKRLAERGIAVRVEGDRLVVNAPKGALDDELASAIRGLKAELVAFLVEAHEGGDDSSEPPMEALPDATERVLTVAQERLWHVDRVDRGAATYNLPGAWRLRGPLDRSALEASVAAFIDRHEVLRWQLDEQAGELEVSVGERPALGFEDLMGPDAESTESRLHAFLDQEARRPFVLEEEPAFRVWLIRLGEADHVLYVVTHSIIWDGWSFDLFLNEISAGYVAVRDEKPDAAPAPPEIRFSDYAAWARGRLDGERVRRDLDWWKQRLDGAIPAMELPFDRERSAVPGHEGGRVYLRLPEALTERLDALARAEGVTLYLVLLTAWKVLLHRYSDQARIVVTTPVRGRPRPELEHLIGVFTNTLFVRTNLSGAPSFRQALVRVRDESLAAQDHQQAPVDLLIDEVPAGRELHRSALYQAMFSYQNTSGRIATMGGLEVEFIQQKMHAVYADLNFWVKHSGRVIMGAIDYRTSLFDRATVARIVEHLTTLLTAAAEAPETSIESLSILPEKEREAVAGLRSGGLAQSPSTAAAARGGHESLAGRVGLTPGARVCALDDAASTKALGVARMLAESVDASFTALAVDRSSLEAQLSEHGVDALFVSPEALLWLAAAGFEPPSGLTVCVVGDGLAQPLPSAHGWEDAVVWSLYAPADDAAVISAIRVEASEGRAVGGPLAGVEVDVVDSESELLPFGVRGRLRVRTGDHARVLTGDAGRLRPTGRIDLCGRTDDRVRIDGELVDPGAVERGLNALPQVEVARVRALRTPMGTNRLVGWFVPVLTEQVTTTQLRRSLAEIVSPAGVPDLLIAVDDLPASQAANDDRSVPTGLPDPFEHASPRRDPETPIEQMIAEVWQSILQVPRVFATDDFGELGGSSILAVRAVLEIERRCGWQPDARLLFFQSLEQIAERAPAGLEVMAEGEA